jgi:cell division protein FtsL
LFLISLLVLAMISALYLDVTSNAAIAGREIQSLRIDITDTQRMNADLETRLASLLSTQNMEQRARAKGFRPGTCRFRA